MVPKGWFLRSQLTVILERFSQIMEVACRLLVITQDTTPLTEIMITKTTTVNQAMLDMRTLWTRAFVKFNKFIISSSLSILSLMKVIAKAILLISTMNAKVIIIQFNSNSHIRFRVLISKNDLLKMIRREIQFLTSCQLLLPLPRILQWINSKRDSCKRIKKMMSLE